MNEFIEGLKRVLTLYNQGPIMVHSDVFRARAAINNGSNPMMILNAHISALEFIVGDRQLIFPVFNYDFPRTKIYDVSSTPSQVGPLTEYVRNNWAAWRHGPPIFNFCGRGNYVYGLIEDGLVDPFGEESLFGHFNTNKGVILMYGAPFSSFTSIHYVERHAGGPLYRYDKKFPGIIRKPEGDVNVILDYHCRPLGKSLDYDWQRLESDATKEGVIKKLEVNKGVSLVVPFDGLVDFWLSKCPAPCDYIPRRSHPLFLAREVLRRLRAEAHPTSTRATRRSASDESEPA